MSQFRAYFYNLNTRKEMVDFEGNGKTWIATSGMKFENGKFIEGTCTSVEVADYSDMRHIKGHRTITAADFDHPVAVKIWYGPDHPMNEWRKLVA